MTKYGVCKVNIDTDLRLALTAKIREVFATKPSEFDPRNYLGPGREAIVKMVRRKLQVLNCVGKGRSGHQAVEETRASRCPRFIRNTGKGILGNRSEVGINAQSTRRDRQAPGRRATRDGFQR